MNKVTMWEMSAEYVGVSDYSQLMDVYFTGEVSLERLLDLLQHMAKGYLKTNPVKQDKVFQTPEWVAYNELRGDVYYIKARYRGGDYMDVTLKPVEGELSPEIVVLDQVQPEVPSYKRINERLDGHNMDGADYTAETFTSWLDGWLRKEGD